MANTIRIKRRASGASGAPSSLENAELAYNEVDDTLYYGKGTGGVGGIATTVEAIGGKGAYVDLTGTQTITGNKTFSGTLALGGSATATTQTAGNNSTSVATTAYVDGAITASTYNFTLAGDSGSSQTIDDAETVTISGGTGLSSVASATNTITLNLDNTAVAAGSYGGAASVGSFTVDAQGRLTAASSTTIEIALGTNTSGSYVATITGGTGVTSSAATTGEGTTHSLSIGQDVATSASVTFAGLTLNSGSMVFEGATADAHETTLAITDPTADRTITLPDATGTVALTANKLSVFAATSSSELAGIISDETGSGALVFGTSPTFTTQITVPSIVKSGTSGTGDIGSVSNYFGTMYGKATTAQYADLAENYQGDKSYTPGTVVMFGGEYEVTLASTETSAVAGVVSTNPAHLMNGGLSGANVVPVALTGRVPCNVIGPVKKGDMMVCSGIPGVAIATDNPRMGSMIGKALEDYDSDHIGTIEIVVGRA
jgi:hypothetical protein